MSDQPEEFSEPILPPHKYPVWLLAVTAVIALAVVYSGILLPRYYSAAKLVEQAQTAEQSHNTRRAISLLAQAGHNVPDSKKIRIEFAYESFKAGTPQDNANAMDALSGITLDADEWSRLSAVMPAEFRSNFTEGDK